jgi:hypothetical protein
MKAYRRELIELANIARNLNTTGSPAEGLRHVSRVRGILDTLERLHLLA